MKCIKKKYRLLLPCVFLAVGSVTASAQWSLGVEGGVTFNTMSIGKSYDYDRSYGPKAGFYFGVPVRYDFNEWFGLQTGLSVMQKNYSMHRSAIYALNEYNYTNTFMDIPVMARFSFGGRKLRGYLLAGGYVGAWLSSNVKGAQMRLYTEEVDYDEGYFGYYRFDEEVDFDSRRDNRFDGGIVGGAGIQYSVTPRISVFAEARFYYGLSDLQKDYMKGLHHRYNNTVAAGAGVMFRLGK